MSLLLKIQDQSSPVWTFTSKERATSHPSDEVYVYMIGSWRVVINNFEYQIRAVTCIIADINLLQENSVDNAKSRTETNTFEDNWLS